jgi:hypothetical protein
MVSLSFDKLRTSGSINPLMVSPLKPLMVSLSNHEQDAYSAFPSFDRLRMSGFLLFLIFFVLSALSAPPLFCAGETAVEFLNLGAGARASGLAGAYSSIAQGASGLHWNPAGLTQGEGRQASLMHAIYVQDASFDHLAYSQKLGDDSGLGINVLSFSAGSIDETDTSGDTVGSFKPTNLSLSVGYASKMGDYSLGASAKLIQAKIIDSANAFALDLGLLSPMLMDDKLRWALTLSNLGGKIKFESESESLPSALRFGSSWKAGEYALLALDLSKPLQGDFFASLGGEYTLPMGLEGGLSGRIGYTTRTSRKLGSLSGLAYGLGWKPGPSFSLDYALEPLGDLGSAHRVSVGFSF